MEKAVGSCHTDLKIDWKSEAKQQEKIRGNYKVLSLKRAGKSYLKKVTVVR